MKCGRNRQIKYFDHSSTIIDFFRLILKLVKSPLRTIDRGIFLKILVISDNSNIRS